MVLSFFRKWTMKKFEPWRASSYDVSYRGQVKEKTRSQMAVKSASNIKFGPSQRVAEAQNSKMAKSFHGDKNDKKTPHNQGPKPSSPKKVQSALNLKTENKSLKSQKQPKYQVCDEPFRCFKDFYKVGPKLGDGTSGSIRICMDKGAGKTYAVKILPKSSKSACESWKSEIEIHRTVCDHPNVVNLREILEDEHFVYIVMEYCKGGDLFDKIKAKKRYSEEEAAVVMNSLISAVSSFNSKNIVHRDLKPENILLASSESATDIRVVDFGESCSYTPNKAMTDVCGSIYYIAPEVIDRSYGPGCDVWSLGVILYILLLGSPPFSAEGQEEIFEKIKRVKLNFDSDLWRIYSVEVRDLLSQMLTKDPSKRITLEKCSVHPWILQYCPKSLPVPAMTSKPAAEPYKLSPNNPQKGYQQSSAPKRRPDLLVIPSDLFEDKNSSRTPGSQKKRSPKTPSQDPGILASENFAAILPSPRSRRHSESVTDAASLLNSRRRSANFDSLPRSQRQDDAWNDAGSASKATRRTIEYVPARSRRSPPEGDDVISTLRPSRSHREVNDEVLRRKRMVDMMRQRSEPALRIPGAKKPEIFSARTAKEAVQIQIPSPKNQMLTAIDLMNVVSSRMNKIRFPLTDVEPVSSLSVDARKGKQSLLLHSKEGLYMIENDINEGKIMLKQVSEHALLTVLGEK